MDRFAREDLLPLVKKGYLEVKNSVSLQKNSNALVAQLTERGFMSDDYDNDYVSRSPRWDLNPRPKVFALHSLSFSSSPTSILSESAGLRNLRRERKWRKSVP